MYNGSLKNRARLHVIFIVKFCFLFVFPLIATAVDEDLTKERNVAVVTLLSSADYVPGAEVLGESLKKVNAKGDRIVLYIPAEVDARSGITTDYLNDLKMVGWEKFVPLTEENGMFLECKGREENWRSVVEEFKELHGEGLINLERYWGTCGKIALFSLTEYDAVIYLDADSIALNNFDHLYDVVHIHGNVLVGAQLEPGCDHEGIFVRDHGQQCSFQTAFLVIRPLQHIFDYLRNVLLSNSFDLMEGELLFFNSIFRSIYALPRWTSIAQTNGKRPFIESEALLDSKGNHYYLVDWGRVLTYDFTGTMKPWICLKHQKDNGGDKLSHPIFGKLENTSNQLYESYFRPLHLWYKHYDDVVMNKYIKTPTTVADEEREI